MTEEPFLTLTDVCKGYGSAKQRTEVLHNINLEVRRGEFLAIVGYSGAGKTTLISMIAGLIAPDSGRIELDGREITKPGPDRGVVFQNYSLLPWLTVYDNIALAVDSLFDWPVEQKRAYIEKYIAIVNLTPARNKKPHELSGGMRQRVAVARALAMNPAILLLDEPLGALDALTRATLQDEIERIWEQDQKTVILITHDVDEALFLSDRVVMMTNGPNATVGDILTVPFARPRDRATVMEHPEYNALRGHLVGFLERQGHKPDTDAAGHAPAAAPPAVSATVAEKTFAKVPVAHMVAPRTAALAGPTH